MSFNDLFQRSKALDREPVFRNANKKPGKRAFDDLLDPDDDVETSTLLASQEADRMRSGECFPMGVDSTNLYSAAILNVFQRHTNFPSRYGDGSFPVWYGSLHAETTIWETVYHMIREELHRRGHHKVIERNRTIFEVSCTAILIDLTDNSPYRSELIDPTSYDFTQQVGRRIRNEGHPGLLAPSARLQGGCNIVVFHPGVLSDPKIIRQLQYQLDPDTMRVDVLDATDQKSVMSVDGKTWLG